jgi:hypothetical protein
MMKHNPQSQVELRDVAAGLWIWRVEHPKWKPLAAVKEENDVHTRTTK